MLQLTCTMRVEASASSKDGANNALEVALGRDFLEALVKSGWSLSIPTSSAESAEEGRVRFEAHVVAERNAWRPSFRRPFDEFGPVYDLVREARGGRRLALVDFHLLGVQMRLTGQVRDLAPTRADPTEVQGVLLRELGNRLTINGTGLDARFTAEWVDDGEEWETEAVLRRLTEHLEFVTIPSVHALPGRRSSALARPRERIAAAVAVTVPPTAIALTWAIPIDSAAAVLAWAALLVWVAATGVLAYRRRSLPAGLRAILTATASGYTVIVGFAGAYLFLRDGFAGPPDELGASFLTALGVSVGGTFGYEPETTDEFAQAVVTVQLLLTLLGVVGAAAWGASRFLAETRAVRDVLGAEDRGNAGSDT